ncbi:MAG: glutathione S-transferase family protein [Pseudomonadota bacterium]
MAEITLFHMPGACSRVTMTALEEAALDYADTVINIMEGEQRTSEYLEINPVGRVPALKVDESVLTENAAILSYIDSLVPEANLLPGGSAPFGRANVLSDLFFCSGSVHIYTRMIRMPIRFSESDPESIKANGMKYMHGVMEMLSAKLEKGPWWYGDDWSIVDVYLRWCYGLAESAGFPLVDYSSAIEHATRVEQWPSYIKALARETAARQARGLKLPPA